MGTPLSTVYRGEPGMLCFKEMGLQVFAVGNHEFDFGQKNFLKLVALSKRGPRKVHIVSANIWKKNGEPYLPASVILPLGQGHSLQVIGLTTKDTPVTTFSLNVKGLIFRDPLTEVRHLLKFVQLILDYKILTPEVIKAFVGKPQGEGDNLSILELMVQEGILQKKMALTIVTIVQDLPLSCPNCHIQYRGSQFQNPKELFCFQCFSALPLSVNDLQLHLRQEEEPFPLEEEGEESLEASSSEPAKKNGSHTNLTELFFSQKDQIEKPGEPRENLADRGKGSEKFSFKPGNRVGGSIEILHFIGRGAMGEVYLGYDHSLQRRVALKILSPLLADADASARFEREAQLEAQVNHPNVVQIFRYEEEEGLQYMVLEYVEGPSLKDVLAQKRRLSLQEALPMVYQVTKGLAAAHKKGILHRDIKPDNIFISNEKVVKLGDFGLAKSRESLSLTQTGMIVGTPYYLSPEQALGEEPDVRSEIYSLGATLYHLLVGHPPFEACYSPKPFVQAYSRRPFLSPKQPPYPGLKGSKVPSENDGQGKGKTVPEPFSPPERPERADGICQSRANPSARYGFTPALSPFSSPFQGIPEDFLPIQKKHPFPGEKEIFISMDFLRNFFDRCSRGNLVSLVLLKDSDIPGILRGKDLFLFLHQEQ